METIIRSPQRGRVAKLVHKPGVIMHHFSKVSFISFLIVIPNRIFVKQALSWFYLKTRNNFFFGILRSLTMFGVCSSDNGVISLIHRVKYGHQMYITIYLTGL